MSQTRGSAVPLTMLVLCTIMLVLSFDFANAAKYKVGDDRGWTFNVDKWPVGKKFVAGDVLVFIYFDNFGTQNVYVVDEEGYNSCRLKDGDKRYSSGYDEIVLKKGKNFFISVDIGACEGGAKIAVNAA